MIGAVSQRIECYSLSSFLRRNLLRGHRECIISRNAPASSALRRPVVQELILELIDELVEETWGRFARIVPKTALSLPITIAQDAFATVALVIRHIVMDMKISSCACAKLLMPGLSLARILLQQLFSQLILILRASRATPNALKEGVEVLLKLLSK